MSKHTNFITAPDFINENEHTILIVDAAPIDIETLAFLCASHSESFDIYLYKESMEDLGWLIQAAGKANTILLNTVKNSISAVKETYAAKENVYHYGDITYPNDRRIESVLSYFATNIDASAGYSTTEKKYAL